MATRWRWPPESCPVMFLAAALISGLIFVLLAYLLAAGIRRLKKPVAITLSLIIVLVVCLGVALNPVYYSGTWQ